MKFNHPTSRANWFSFMKSFAPEVDPLTIRLMDEMIMVSRGLYQMSEHSLTHAGLSFAQYRLLMGLLYSEQMEGRTDGLNPSEISERNGTSRNTISALLRNLEEHALVERHLDPQDRRKFNICITEAGRELVREHARRHLDVVGNCFTVLETAEQTALSALLQKVGGRVGQLLETERD